MKNDKNMELQKLGKKVSFIGRSSATGNLTFIVSSGISDVEAVCADESLMMKPSAVRAESISRGERDDVCKFVRPVFDDVNYYYRMPGLYTR